MSDSDWNTRKMAIDCMYTTAALLNDVIIPFKKEILDVLSQCRSDKMKPVREATLEAINLIKEIGPQVDESETESIRGKKERNKREPRPWDKKPKTEIPRRNKAGITDASEI